MIKSNNKPKKTGVVSDVFGQLLETGQKTAKTAGQQLSPGQFVRTAGQQIKPGVQNKQRTEPLVKPNQARSVNPGPAGEVNVNDLSDQQFERIKKQKQIQAMRRYQEIQSELQRYRQLKNQQIPKNISGQPGFDEEKLGQPQTPQGLGPLSEPTPARKKGIFGAFGGKNKRKPSSQQQQNMGTGERRGIK